MLASFCYHFKIILPLFYIIWSSGWEWERPRERDILPGPGLGRRGRKNNFFPFEAAWIPQGRFQNICLLVNILESALGNLLWLNWESVFFCDRAHGINTTPEVLIARKHVIQFFLPVTEFNHIYKRETATFTNGNNWIEPHQQTRNSHIHIILTTI